MIQIFTNYILSYREDNVDVWDMISNVLVLWTAMANCANSREATHVPAIRVETAVRAERARTASAFSASAERATEAITAKQSPILVDRILVYTAAYALMTNLGSLIS